jgi:fructose-specific phosphotransferase system IIC component
MPILNSIRLGTPLVSFGALGLLSANPEAIVANDILVDQVQDYFSIWAIKILDFGCQNVFNLLIWNLDKMSVNRVAVIKSLLSGHFIVEHFVPFLEKHRISLRLLGWVQ